MAGSSPSLPDGSNPSAAIVQSASDVQCSRLLKTTTVTYEELLGSGESIQTKTCGRAFVMCCEPVIMVEDVSGAVSLDHCTVVAEEAA